MREAPPTDPPPPPEPAGGAGALSPQLVKAASSPARPETAFLLGNLDPESLDGVALVQAILTCQRVMSWLDATQQAFLAALARPGVAVPIERVVDAARWSVAKPGELSAPDAVIDALLESGTDPAADPHCGSAIANHAARFASMEVAAAPHLSPLPRGFG